MLILGGSHMIRWDVHVQNRHLSPDSKEFFIVVLFVRIEIFIIYPYYPFNSWGAIVISLLSFLILITFAFSLFIHVILPSGFSIILPFSKATFLFHWFFSIVFVFTFIDFCSLLFHSFCLLWVYFALLFFGFLRWNLGLLLWDHTFFLI